MRDVCFVLQFPPSALHYFDEAHRLPIQCRMRGRGCRSNMGLERHVAEIVECQHAVIGRFTQNRRHGQSHRREEFGHVHEGKRLVIERCRADSQHERTSPRGHRKYRRSGRHR